MLRATLAIALAAALAPHAAHADTAAGDACAKGLSPQARMIYSAAAPDLTKDTVIRDLVTSRTRQLVRAGRIERTAARPAAEAAGTCLKELRR